MRFKRSKIRKFIVPIGRRQLDSEGSIKYDENPQEEEASFQEATSVIVQSLAEKIKEEATQTTKPKDEPIKPAEPKDPSSGERIYNVEVVEKRDVPTSKVEPAAEKPKEEVKEKGNDTIQKTEESPEKIKMISKDVVIETEEHKSWEDDQHPHNEEGTDETTTSTDADNKNPGDDAEGMDTVVATPRDQEDAKKEDSFHCVSSLAQGLQSLCAPRTAK